MIEQSNSLPVILFSTLHLNRCQKRLQSWCKAARKQNLNLLLHFILSSIIIKHSFYCHIWQVMLKMKSRHVAGTLTKKKKSESLLSCFYDENRIGDLGIWESNNVEIDKNKAAIFFFFLKFSCFSNHQMWWWMCWRIFRLGPAATCSRAESTAATSHWKP